jgi:MFS family permease
LSKEAAPLLENKRSSKIYYGYIVLVASFFIMVFTYGTQSSFGVFFKPMLNEFGWTRAETAGPFALLMMVSGACSIISGRLSDRFGARKVVSLGAIILGTGYILTSRITGLWQLYVFYGVLVAAGSSAMYVPPVTMIAKWFSRRRGLMSGFGISGIGFGIGIMPAISSQLIVSFEWRTALLAVGATSLVAILLLAQLLKVKPAPASPAGDKENQAGIVSPAREYSFREAVKTHQYWLIFVAWIFYGYMFQIGVVHSVPYATDLGMTAVAAATVLTVIGIIGTAGRVSLGFVGDRIGIKTTVYVSYGLMAAAYLGLSVSRTVGMLYAFAVIFGALSGVGILLVPIVAERYGFKELGIISGTIVFANSLGGAISPPLAGAIFDGTGSYRWAFISCAILGLAASLVIWRLGPTRKDSDK